MQFTINFQGICESKEWPHFAWLAVINGETFNYRTGLGHATKRYTAGKFNPNKKPVNSVTTDTLYVHIPQLDDILECLFSDASAGAESFDDFCDNMGYSNDSLKALDTYRACMGLSKQLRKALGDKYETERLRIENRVFETDNDH